MTSNSISALQEHCVHNALPIPSYHFEDLTQPSTPSRFACHCKMGHITAVAKANSKKEAKHDVAKLVMQKLGIYGGGGQSGSPSSSAAEGASPKPVMSAALDNPIGKMNEYCAKNRYMYPSYYEMGVKNGEFVVQCKHQSFVTEGLANNKKVAKQLAAYNMLIMLNKAPAKRSWAVSSTTQADECWKDADVIDRPEKQYSDDEIIKLYHEIVKKREQVPTKLEPPAYTLTDPFSPSEDSDTVEEPEEEDENETEQVSTADLADLERQFDALDLDYSIQVVSQEPLIMSMQLPDATFMDMGSTAAECKKKLFTIALDKYKKA